MFVDTADEEVVTALLAKRAVYMAQCERALVSTPALLEVDQRLAAISLKYRPRRVGSGGRGGARCAPPRRATVRAALSSSDARTCACVRACVRAASLAFPPSLASLPRALYELRRGPLLGGAVKVQRAAVTHSPPPAQQPAHSRALPPRRGSTLTTWTRCAACCCAPSCGTRWRLCVRACWRCPSRRPPSEATTFVHSR